MKPATAGAGGMFNPGSEGFNVLIVDDDATQRRLQREILEIAGCTVFEAGGGNRAIAIIRERELDVVLLDRRMPDMSGDDVCRWIRDQAGIHFLPIIMVTADEPRSVLRDNLNSGYANDYVRKPFDPLELIARVRAAAQLKRKTDQLEKVESLLFSLARMVEAKDRNTGDHCNRLAHTCAIFGQSLGLREEEIMALRRGGVLHDIGKLGIPDRILLKAGPLDEDEMCIMRQHTVIGAELCSGLKTLKSTVPIIRHHHERFDGSGYPDGLAAGDIPMLARVFQIADIYDALAHSRVYKRAWATGRIVEVLEKETAQGWRDPELVSVFLGLLHNRQQDLLRRGDGSDGRGQDIFEKIQATGVLQERKRASHAGR